MRRCKRGGTLIVGAVGISLVLVAAAFGGQSGKKGGKMARVIQKEQILLGELGIPNFPEKVGAWDLASDWKTEGQAGVSGLIASRSPTPMSKTQRSRFASPLGSTALPRGRGRRLRKP
jgi:hypothetical protein